MFSEAVARLVVWALVGKQTEAEASANAHIKALEPLFDPEWKVKNGCVMQFFLRLCTL